MAITTSLVWHVRDVDRETSDGFIYHAAWELRGFTKKDGVGIATFRFESDVNFPKIRTGNEIGFSSVTKANVVDWVKTGLGTTEVAKFESLMHDALIDIHAKPNPGDGMSSGTPWEDDDEPYIASDTVLLDD
mgnify:CR=1 FL=1